MENEKSGKASFSELKKAYTKKSQNANAIMSGKVVPSFNVIPTGIFKLDYALLGGIPEGAVTMIYGYAGSGKTTITSKIVAEALKKYPNKVALYIDAENRYDTIWAEKHGVDLDRLEVFRSASGEETVDFISSCVSNVDDIAIIVIDSIPAIIPTKEADSSAEDALMARRAALMGRLSSFITHGFISNLKSNTKPPAIVFINQFRTKVGQMFGDPRTLPGGEQITNYLPTVKIELKKPKIEMKTNKDGASIPYQQLIEFEITKSSLGNSMRAGSCVMVKASHDEFDDSEGFLMEGQIDDYSDVVTALKKHGLYTGGGGAYTLEGVEKKFNKEAELARYFQQNPEVFTYYKQKMIMIRRIKNNMKNPTDNYILTELK